MAWAFLVTGVLGIAMGLITRVPAAIAGTAIVILAFAGFGALTERPVAHIALTSLAAAVAFQVCYFVGILLAARLRSSVRRR